MNILVVAPYFAPFGGVGSARINSLTAFLAEKHQVTVLCFDSSLYDSKLCTAEIPEGVILERINGVHSRRLFSIVLKKRLIQLLTERHFDICICTVGPFDAMYYIKAIKKFPVKVIVDYRDNWISTFFKLDFKRKLVNRLYRLVETKSFRYADAIVCVSDGQRETVKNAYQIPDHKIVTIRNGFDEKQISALNVRRTASDGKKLLVTISGKCAYYDETAGYELLLAAKQLNKDFFALKINHIGSAEKQMLDYSKMLGIEKEVYDPIGHVPYVDSVKRLIESDVLVLPYSSIVGLGTKVFDYIFANKPVLVIQKGESELKAFVEQFPGGFSAEPDHDEIMKVLRTIKENHIDSLGVKDTMEYSRLYQNRRYESFLNQMIWN